MQIQLVFFFFFFWSVDGNLVFWSQDFKLTKYPLNLSFLLITPIVRLIFGV